MRKLLGILFIVLFSSIPAFAQQETNPDGHNIFYHPNGQKASEGLMRDGKPDSYWKTYNDQGILISEGNRKNFELDSTWRFYDDSGKIKLEINYKAGKKDGVRKTYREDGIVEETFRGDIKQGPTTYYFTDGKIRQVINFSKGLEQGISMEYDHDGRVITLITYKSGFIVDRELINRFDNDKQKHGTWKYFFPNGTIRMEGAYKHGLENGYFKEYDMDGNLTTTSKYVDGVKQEDVAELAKLEMRKDYYPDGKVKISATYNKEGKPEGIRREFAPDGTIEKSYIFKNGVVIGEGVVTEKGERDGFWKEYFDDGVLRAEGKYNKDQKEGPWKFYHRTGTLEQEGIYKNGKPEGQWLWYYDSGELLREETYYNGLQDGLMTEYDQDGTVITKGEYIEGKENGDWFYITNDSKVEGAYAEGMRNGLWKYYDLRPMGEQEMLRFEGRFIEDNPNDRHTWYWDNGKRKEEGDYVMGRMEGDWIYYNYDGTVFLIVSYKDGIEQKYDGIKITGATSGQE